MKINESPLSAQFQSDLITYHANFVNGDDKFITPQQVIVRAIAAIADVHAGTLTILKAVQEKLKDNPARQCSLYFIDRCCRNVQ